MGQTFLNNSGVRGLRNNNPGNLRRTSDAWQGKIPFSQSKDAEFEQFYEIAWGIRAFFKNVVTKYNRGQKTIASFVTVYAPPSENNTASYIAQVAAAMGITPTTQYVLTKDNMIKLAKAMFKIELGAAAAATISNASYEDAWFYYETGYSYGSANLPNLTIGNQKKCPYCKEILAGLALFFLSFYTLNLVNENGNETNKQSAYNSKISGFGIEFNNIKTK